MESTVERFAAAIAKENRQVLVKAYEGLDKGAFWFVVTQKSLGICRIVSAEGGPQDRHHIEPFDDSLTEPKKAPASVNL